MVRLDMHPSDISKTLLDIYASAGYTSIDAIIANLHRLTGGVQHPERGVTGCALTTLPVELVIRSIDPW